MHRGYIKLWRKIEDSFIWKDPEALMIWVILLMKANYKDTEFMFNSKKVILRRGQLITGLNQLSLSTGVTKSKCYRVLKCLESETLIEIQKTNRYSIISIVKYSEYQDNETLNETPVKLQRNSSETPVETSKELIRTNKNKDKPINPSLYPYLLDVSFYNAYCNFLEMRKSKKNEATSHAKKLILDKLSKESIETAIAMLEESTIRGWSGVFPLKNNYSKQSNGLLEGYN